MAERGVVLAVDIGTSATKAVLFDGHGHALSLARRAYPLLTPRPDWAEQDPAVVYPAVLAASREAYQNRPPGPPVDAVALSAQWYSTMPVAADDRALCPFLTWSDRRSAVIADGLRWSEAGHRIYRATGCPIDAIYPLSKIIWLLQAELPAPPARFISIVGDRRPGEQRRNRPRLVPPAMRWPGSGGRTTRPRATCRPRRPGGPDPAGRGGADLSPVPVR